MKREISTAVKKMIQHPTTGKHLSDVFVTGKGWYSWNTAFHVYNSTANYSQLQKADFALIDFTKERGKENVELKWFSQDQAHGGVRHRLYSRANRFQAWQETPYFVDAAPNSAHYTYGEKYGLYGSGMGTLITRADVPYRIAACFGGFSKIRDAKAKAEEMVKGTS